MIKINLLPAHILDRQRVKSVIPPLLVIWVALAVILAVMTTRKKAELSDRNTELAYWQTEAMAVGQVKGQADGARGEAASYGRWKDWTDRIDAYHAAWQTQLIDIAKYIYARVQVSSISPTPQSVTIVGATDSIDSFKKAYLNILNSPLYNGQVTFSISGVSGGWSPPAMPGARPGGPAPAMPGANRGVDREDRLIMMQQQIARQGPQAAAAPAAAAGPAQAGLPYQITFNCQLTGDYAGKLTPSFAPPIGAVTASAPAGDSGGSAPSGGLAGGMSHKEAKDER